MKKMTGLFVMVCLVFVLASFVPAVLAQDQSPTPPSQQNPNQTPPAQQYPSHTPDQDHTLTPGQTPSDQSQSLSGKLKSVDSDAKKLTVTDAAGTDTEFYYNDRTEIVGAEGTVEGLSGNAGSDVTVSYTESQGQKTATRIEVKKSDTGA